jgi:hypothetical protein
MGFNYKDFFGKLYYFEVKDINQLFCLDFR